MKNTVTAKPANRIRLSCLPVIVALMLAATPQPASAKDQVPFRGSFDTVVELTLNFPMLNAHITGQGIATHLGLTTFETTDQAVNVLNNEGTATYYFTAANGDQIVVEFHFTAPPTPTGVALSDTWEITGGTGRFANASGSGTTEGWATVTGPTTAVGHFSMSGRISSPGSLAR